MILTARLLIEETAKWEEEVWLVKVDFEDAFGTMRHPDAWSSLITRVGVRRP